MTTKRSYIPKQSILKQNMHGFKYVWLFSEQDVKGLFIYLCYITLNHESLTITRAMIFIMSVYLSIPNQNYILYFHISFMFIRKKLEKGKYYSVCLIVYLLAFWCCCYPCFFTLFLKIFFLTLSVTSKSKPY